MKNIILGSVLAVAAVTSLSANAAAFTVCNGAALATDGAQVVGNTDGSTFVRTSFTPKCSANVFLVGDDVSSTVYRVGAASAKGKTRFNGSTIGGAVAPVSTGDPKCGNTPCNGADAASAAAAAPSS
jgi:hypothetical protein